jgi:glutathione S-transferase
MQVLTGSFLLRLYGLGKPEHDLVSGKLLPAIAKQAPKFDAWAQKVVQQESVNYIWDEKKVAEGTKAMIAKMAEKKA